MKVNLIKSYLKKFWNFIWYDDSALSWIVNIILAFVLIKFVIDPGLGFILGTDYPVVAVVSESMEHNENFNSWWSNSKKWYEQNGITEEQFSLFNFKNGFNKGDIMVLMGEKPADIQIGEIIVFSSPAKPDPIIHRVVKKTKKDEYYIFTTKGDNHITNPSPIKDRISGLDETEIKESQILGTAGFRIPFIGYIKIGFVRAVCYDPIEKIIKYVNPNLRC